MRYVFLRFPDGKHKAVTLSYDDGDVYDIKISDILGKYGLKCTFNIVSRQMREQGYELRMSREDVKKYILDRGHEVAVHGAHHRAEGKQRAIVGIRDVLDCRMDLETAFDTIIRGMAYPDTGIREFTNGSADYPTVKQYLTDLDIAYARTLGGDNNGFAMPTDWHAWMPTAHHTNPQIFEYIEEFNGIVDSDTVYGARRQPRLFYMWGHGFEFERNNDWSRLEEICRALGGRDDVWYATNIEIYDYVHAYESLIYSADETKVYNPTVTTVWISVDGKIYKIEPGQTVRIG